MHLPQTAKRPVSMTAKVSESIPYQALEGFMTLYVSQTFSANFPVGSLLFRASAVNS